MSTWWRGSRQGECDGRRFDDYDGNVLGVDATRDLAVVSICCGDFTALEFGDAAALEAGDEVVNIGYALGFSGEATVTKGIVSALRYDSRYQAYVIQSDAVINPGNSGGPMLSPEGQILGINTFKYVGTASGREGLGFAISADGATAHSSVLRAGTAVPTATPVSHSNTLRRGKDTTLGPMNGDLRHDPSNGLYKDRIRPTFRYPTWSLKQRSSILMRLRPIRGTMVSFSDNDRLMMMPPILQFVVSSNRRWAVLTGSGTPYERIGAGTVGNLNRGAWRPEPLDGSGSSESGDGSSLMETTLRLLI